jgi:hypothetical protein
VAEFNWADLAAAAAEAGFGGPIPNGSYRLRVSKAEVTKTKDNSKQKIAVQFKVMEGPHAGTVLFNDFVISPENPKALGYFFRDMKTLGFGDDYFATNPPLARVAGEMVDREVTGLVGTREWQGQEKNEIQRIRPVTGAVTTASLPQSAPMAPMAPPMAPVAPQQVPSQPAVPMTQVASETPTVPQPATPQPTNDAPPIMPSF